ncbi:heat-shock protein [Flavobacterium sp. LM5]|jgi:AcrR family transcriptional regulator|uniref:TetR family transcriptional regulator C-terminal domain-containing protein n=1 Tax=Flavobacterium sp. LM5 TaxID=1938610 RepID=UPI0009934F48|nr:TetR family transcriptional regulator C-terminal domain-containing protein [Flavobacterium sp. LM5]OOV27848.1 heat-shock protein [Flavobacterium sp. LM5]
MATKKNELTKEKIISLYMNYVLEHNAKPKSIYQFTKENGFSEAQLYAYFGTLDAIEKEIFIQFFDKTIELLDKNPSYTEYDMRGKLLSFYFTFFELLTANRSYVLYALQQHKNQLKNVMLLADIRKKFKNYIGEITTDDFRIQIERFQEYQEKATKESLWIQFLLTLKFWMEDHSAGFEKTDIYIEKSVKAAFELMNITPIDSLIDFGKFLFKEKIQKN